MGKSYFAVLAIGRDTSGIVAAITEVLARKHSCNVETSHMMILGGHFASAVIASSDAPFDSEELEADLENSGTDSPVRHVYVSPINSADFRPFGDPEPSHMITTHADDRAGLIYEVAKALADNSINITGLLSGWSEDGQRVCSVSLEVSPPDGLGGEELRRIVLEAVPGEVEVEVERMRKRTEAEP